MLHYLQNLFQALDVSSLTDAVLRVAAVFLCLTVHETCHGLAALALLVAYLAGRKHRVRAFFRLLLCILCAAGAVALYFLGIYKEYFTIRDFFVIRAAGWIGLAIAAFFVLLALVRAFFAAADARREQKAAADRKSVV